MPEINLLLAAHKCNNIQCDFTSVAVIRKLPRPVELMFRLRPFHLLASKEKQEICNEHR